MRTTTTTGCVNISWLVGQTGVSYPTMLRHYGTFLRSEGLDQLARLSANPDENLSGSDKARELVSAAST